MRPDSDYGSLASYLADKRYEEKMKEYYGRDESWWYRTPAYHNVNHFGEGSGFYYDKPRPWQSGYKK